MLVLDFTKSESLCDLTREFNLLKFTEIEMIEMMMMTIRVLSNASRYTKFPSLNCLIDLGHLS